MNFSKALEALKKGKKVALPEWKGYWQISTPKGNLVGEKDTILMHCKDGRILDINGQMDSVFFTMDNICREDWVILDDDYEISDCPQVKVMNTVTPAMVAANMKDVVVKTINELKPTTVVQIRMKNGFILTDSTTCVDPANYSEEIGKEILLGRMETEVWKLLGFELSSKIYGTALVEK